MAPARGVTLIKFENRKLQEFAIPVRGVTAVKFITRGSGRNVEIRQQYCIVVLIKRYRHKTEVYLECGTSLHSVTIPNDRANK